MKQYHKMALYAQLECHRWSRQGTQLGLNLEDFKLDQSSFGLRKKIPHLASAPEFLKEKIQSDFSGIGTLLMEPL